jgi:predicted RNA binding protein YcfA (HicA-like mRNA interferase family)
MKLPRNLTGRILARSLCRNWEYRQVHQTGSHIILETEDPSHHRIAVPDHKALRVGTLNGILRAVSSHKGVPREDVLELL